MDARELKDVARRAGADLVGVVDAEAWADWPEAERPTRIQPRCRAVVVVARRVLRGAFRGVEEGTSFGNTYGMYGQSWNEQTFLARTVHDVAHAIEATGAEAMPLPGGVGLDAMRLAEAAGLGRIGKGGFFLTPAYGHRQRFGYILTDAAFAGDAPADWDPCKDCEACLTACPLGALTRDGEGRFALDTTLCAVCANGRVNGGADAYQPLDRLAAACGRACLVAMESRVDNRFEHPFRKRAVWTRDLDGHPTVNPLETKGTAQ